MFSQQNSNKISKEELIKETEEVEILSISFYETSINLTLKTEQDNNLKKERKKKEIYRPILFINLDIKILNKI